MISLTLGKGRTWNKSQKLDLNGTLDVAGTPIIPPSHVNTLPEILCPHFNNLLTSLIPFLQIHTRHVDLILYDIQPDTDIQSLVLLSPHILPQAHPRHLLCLQGITLVTPFSVFLLWSVVSIASVEEVCERDWFLIPIPTSARSLYLSHCCCKILRKPDSDVAVDIFTENHQLGILVLPAAPAITFQWLNLVVRVISYRK